MSNENQIHLKTSSISNVHFQSYTNDFTFFVNGEEFKTSRIVSDLLSPIISNEHLNDPTFSNFTINTKSKGDFHNVLKLLTFEYHNISDNELPFIFEVFKILHNDFIEFVCKEEFTEIKTSSVFSRFKKHLKNPKFYQKILLSEIDFISSHFTELSESHFDDFASLDLDTLLSILDNPKLQTNDEDQLLKFVNKLYSNDSTFSILYETICFANVSSEAISEFIENYDFNELTKMTWQKLCDRLIIEIPNQNQQVTQSGNLLKNRKVFSFNGQNPFSGIINYLNTKTSFEIEKEIRVTASSFTYQKRNPLNVTFHNDRDKLFCSKNEPNSWICFDFKEHRVVPTAYSIKSTENFTAGQHPENWVIEGSVDGEAWMTVDEVKNNSDLNGNGLFHTFSINKKNLPPFKLIKIRQTGKNWLDDDQFIIDSFELFGTFL